MACEVKPANLRDLSYVASHMRASDRAEVECQIDEWSAVNVAALSLRDHAYVVELDGNPEAAFGCGQVRRGYWIAWSWGTGKLLRCVPAMVAFITDQLQPAVYEAGAFRVEARALASHRQAQRFLERIGGSFCCNLPAYGKNGEDFVLYQWTRKTYGLGAGHMSGRPQDRERRHIQSDCGVEGHAETKTGEWVDRRPSLIHPEAGVEPGRSDFNRPLARGES